MVLATQAIWVQHPAASLRVAFGPPPGKREHTTWRSPRAGGRRRLLSTDYQSTRLGTTVAAEGPQALLLLRSRLQPLPPNLRPRRPPRSSPPSRTSLAGTRTPRRFLTYPRAG